MTTPTVTAAIIRTVALTLRQLAGWGAGRQEMSDQEFLDLATQVEHIEPGWCCPMCEEVECDGGCPLEPVREFDSAALRQLTIDGDVLDTGSNQDHPAGPLPSTAGSEVSRVLPRGA